MDTIEISLELIKGLNMEAVQEITNNIGGLKSPYGYTYCNVLQYSKTGNLIIKISYPRFYAGNNAFLISKRSECFIVQNHFSENIMNDYRILNLNISRIDIPFTYYMNNNEDFLSYWHIYQIFAYVYDIKFKNANAKAYIDLLTKNVETLIYSDSGKGGKNYNSRLEIYNQHLNLSNKIEEIEMEDILLTYPDLPQRVRMEVSKRIRLRKTFTGVEFSQFDILGNYFEKYKKYILDNILDFKVIEDLYTTWALQLANILIERKALGNVNYEIFILQNEGIIYDYEIIRRAVALGIDNINTRENAITRIRKILNNHQLQKNIIVMDTYAVLCRIRNVIQNYKLLD